MKLSIVVVNYNVKFFIEQCLYSVQRAIEDIETEVFVVDNNSVDGSCELIKEKFPWVKLIENKNNVGFSKANNQALKNAVGEYVLLLNPDTIVQEETFRSIIKFMDAHPQGGGLGVKMIDGKGHFLPESKRGVPTPMVAFYKMFGLAKIFPRSKVFGQYHLSYLDKDEIHEIEILSGAFMFMRKSVLDEIGYLDEDYFMYGEDIDLSYRIIKAGYKNYYYPETTIIHYKGESTKKGSVNYVLIFYKAMIIFAKKQLSSKHSVIFSFLINIAIFFRAFLALCNRLTKQLLLPLMDSVFIYLAFVVLSHSWEYIRHMEFGENWSYPPMFYLYVIPGYIFVWLSSLFLNGAYTKPVKLKYAVHGAAVGLAVILIIYSLLNEEYRFSRALILLGGIATMFVVLTDRLILHLFGFEEFKLKRRRSKRIVLAGAYQETERVKSLLSQTGLMTNIVGCVGDEVAKHKVDYLGKMEQLREVITIHKIDEIIFCLQDVSTAQIIENMLSFSDVDVDFKIAPPEAVSVIGSNSINTAGELYTLEINSIAKKYNKKKKRLLDVLLSFLFLFSYPLLLFTVKKKAGFFKNIFQVIFGKKTWVSYNKESLRNTNLPSLKNGVISPSEKGKFSPEAEARLNVIYAKDYSVYNDLSLILKNFRQLGK